MLNSAGLFAKPEHYKECTICLGEGSRGRLKSDQAKNLCWLPLPLLAWFTVREMLDFTTYWLRKERSSDGHQPRGRISVGSHRGHRPGQND